MRHSFQEGQGVHTTTKLKNGYPPACLDHKDLSHLLSTSVFSHHNPLLGCHSPSTVKEKYSSRDSRPLNSIKPTTRPHTFPGTACPGPCHSQVPPLPAPNPAGKKRDLATRPMQPDDVQRIVAHIAFSRATGRHTFVFRPSFAFTLPHWTLWASHFPFVTRRYARTSSGLQQRGGTNVCLEEGAEGFTTRHRRRLLLDQEEKKLAMRPVLPWHNPLHGCCA